MDIHCIILSTFFRVFKNSFNSMLGEKLTCYIVSHFVSIQFSYTRDYFLKTVL